MQRQEQRRYLSDRIWNIRVEGNKGLLYTQPEEKVHVQITMASGCSARYSGSGNLSRYERYFLIETSQHQLEPLFSSSTSLMYLVLVEAFEVVRGGRQNSPLPL